MIPSTYVLTISANIAAGYFIWSVRALDGMLRGFGPEVEGRAFFTKEEATADGRRFIENELCPPAQAFRPEIQTVFREIR
ncbi:hypothetical protein PAQ31011_00838 [Pandoraea aquatica]|uniref:Uncharacterized protein n=1 Tax=Pandoraea aquatica TaxID=2508290 RepID=A0A5E4SJG0_9BURK|nr:hypothetical protein [Pandoraea aquatica]VVD75311.1 hypothetical protein PAQ31011_00838 [Pandoraea aquatica]